MGIKLRFESATGETRNWTLKEIAQGMPLGHPSHAMFIHFPVAFYIAVLAFDMMSRLHPDAALVYGATLLIIGAFAGTALAAGTGLVDWWGMVRGSRKRRWATKHMLLQVAAFALFAVVLGLRWPHRHAGQASVGWIAVEAVGVLVMLVGQWMGGVLVYEMAMRVSTRRSRQAA